MIQLSNSTILVLHPDASTEPLDTEEVKRRIFRACLAAGENESWIAEDLSLAVEFSLLTKKDRRIRAEELNQLILSTLEAAGYPSVAVEYKRATTAVPVDFLPVSELAVRQVLSRNLAMDETQKDRIVTRVLKSLELIGLEHVSGGLILELGRQFRDTDIVVPERKIAWEEQPKDSFILLPQDVLERSVSRRTTEFLRSGVLQVSHISRLFSVLRIDLSLTKFSEMHGLEKPVTELAFWSVCGELAESVDGLCRAADSVCLKNGEPGCTPLPLLLTVLDASLFAGNYMNVTEKSEMDCIRTLLGTFTGSLRRQPFKVQLQ